jgi:hypothetical protein
VGDDDWDTALHRDLTPAERLDAILESQYLTTDQAVAAMSARFDENQSTFPHLVVATVDAASEPGGARAVPFVTYVGPFVDLAAARAWAEATFAANENVRFTCERVDIAGGWRASGERPTDRGDATEGLRRLSDHGVSAGWISEHRGPYDQHSECHNLLLDDGAFERHRLPLFGALCDNAEAAAVFDLRLVRPSLTRWMPPWLRWR